MAASAGRMAKIDELRAVRQPRHEFAHVVRLAIVDGGNARDVVGFVDGRGDVRGGEGWAVTVPVEARHDFACEAQAMRVVVGEVLHQPRDRGVHLGRAELAVI